MVKEKSVGGKSLDNFDDFVSLGMFIPETHVITNIKLTIWIRNINIFVIYSVEKKREVSLTEQSWSHLHILFNKIKRDMTGIWYMILVTSWHL